MSTTTYPPFSVDKFVDKVVDKMKFNISEEYISPYLKRPLRSLADALAERRAPSAPSHGSKAKVRPAKDSAQQRVAGENRP
jgi:hypothetical protein